VFDWWQVVYDVIGFSDRLWRVLRVVLGLLVLALLSLLVASTAGWI
jgi:hypothetical protein